MSFLKPSAAPQLFGLPGTSGAPASPNPPPMFGQRPQGSPGGAGTASKSGGYAGTILGGTAQPAFTSNNKTLLGGQS